MSDFYIDENGEPMSFDEWKKAVEKNAINVKVKILSTLLLVESFILLAIIAR
jgi:hypothetical protein